MSSRLLKEGGRNFVRKKNLFFLDFRKAQKPLFSSLWPRNDSILVKAGYNPGWVAYLDTIFIELLHRHVHLLILPIVKLGLLPDDPFINLAEAPLADEILLGEILCGGFELRVCELTQFV